MRAVRWSWISGNVGPQYPGGFAGHTLSVCGYIVDENLYILCDPAVATFGQQLITAALKKFWRSDYFGAKTNAVLSRPALVIVDLAMDCLPTAERRKGLS